MIVQPDFLTHWKTQMLCDELKDKSAPLCLIALWSHCQNRRSDTFNNLAPDALKAICRYDGEASKLCSALERCGFIDRDGVAIVVHGWAEVNGKLLANWSNGKKGGRPKGDSEKPKQNPKLESVNPIETETADQQTQPKPIREEKRRLEKIREEDISRTKVLSSNSDELDLGSPAKKKADPVPYLEIFKLYSDCCPSLKQMQIRSNKRDQSAKRIWAMACKYGRNKTRENASKDETQWAWHYLEVLFQTANETGFLIGKNDRGWKADFEFVTREDKAVKILEEGYQS